MKKFSFSLQALLDVRVMKEDEIKRKLALKNSDIQQSKNQLLTIQNKLGSFQNEQKIKRAAGEDLACMIHSVSYRNHLKLSMLKEGRRLDDLSAEAYNIQKELIKASQERKTVEILREKRLAEWKKSLRQNEQMLSDEVSRQGFLKRAADVLH